MSDDNKLRGLNCEMFNPKNWSSFLINIDSRTDRLKRVSEELKRLGISFSRFEAIKPDDLSSCPNLHFSKLFTKRGNIGCYMSHYQILKRNLNRNSGALLILEDDVVFCDDFMERIEYIRLNFNEDWDVFHLSAFFHHDPAWWYKENPNTEFMDHKKTSIKHIHRTYGSFTTHAYLVNPNSIQKIMNGLERICPHVYAIDHAYIKLQPELNWYSFVPGMTTQENGYSDISNRVEEYTKHFKEVAGNHVYASKLENFDYDSYFKE